MQQGRRSGQMSTTPQKGLDAERRREVSPGHPVLIVLANRVFAASTNLARGNRQGRPGGMSPTEVLPEGKSVHVSPSAEAIIRRRHAGIYYPPLNAGASATGIRRGQDRTPQSWWRNGPASRHYCSDQCATTARRTGRRVPIPLAFAPTASTASAPGVVTPLHPPRSVGDSVAERSATVQ